MTRINVIASGVAMEQCFIGQQLIKDCTQRPHVMRNAGLYQFVGSFSLACARWSYFKFFHAGNAVFNCDELWRRVPGDKMSRGTIQRSKTSHERLRARCATHMELDLEPTKRVQNFGGGLGPAGGGRHALASKSISLRKRKDGR